MSINKRGTNPASARENNIALILKLLIKHGVLSRLQLSGETGLTQAGITYITKQLIEWKLIEETGALEGSTKRPSIGLKISEKKFNVIGARINRDSVWAEVFTLDGNLLHSTSVKFEEPITPRQILSELIKCIEKVSQYVSADAKIAGIGVALPGPFLPQKGKIELMSGIPGWSEIDITAELSGKFNVPIILEHDANCGALAEMWIGKLDDERNILFININDGIGAGLICNGKLYKGQIGIAGEIGHMSINYDGPQCECGNNGCLELYCSIKKLKSDYKLITGKDFSVEEILSLAKNEDSDAVEALRRSASYLGIGLAGLVNILNPGVIILSDIFSEAGQVLVDIVRESMNKCLLPEIAEKVDVRISSEPGTSITQKGSAMAVVEYLLKNSTKYFTPEN